MNYAVIWVADFSFPPPSVQHYLCSLSILALCDLCATENKKPELHMYYLWHGTGFFSTRNGLLKIIDDINFNMFVCTCRCIQFPNALMLLCSIIQSWLHWQILGNINILFQIIIWIIPKQCDEQHQLIAHYVMKRLNYHLYNLCDAVISGFVYMHLKLNLFAGSVLKMDRIYTLNDLYPSGMYVMCGTSMLNWNCWMLNEPLLINLCGFGLCWDLYFCPYADTWF